MNSEEGPVDVSIIIPAYNASATLRGQLEAIRQQSDSADLEVLLCDNGSSDDTSAIASTYADAGMRLRVIDASARRGPSAARNIGAAHARGRLLLFCDSDDIVDPGWVVAMVHALGVADLAAGALDAASLNTHNHASVTWAVSAEIRMRFWPRFGAGASSNLGIRAHVFTAVGGFDERLQTGEDVDLCWRVQLAGFSFARTNDAVVRSRQRDGRRAVFRQAYSYGAGSKALRRKYRNHIYAFDGSRVDEIILGTPRPSPIGVSHPSLPRRLAGVFTARGQANLAWRIGEGIGVRYGAVHPGIDSIPVA